MDPTAIDRLLALAREQHSLFTTAQARAEGITRDRLRSWSRAGRIEPWNGGVWTITGVASSSERTAQAVLLAHGHGAALCRSSAAWVLEVPGHVLEPVSVIRSRDEHLSPISTAHTSRALEACDVTVRRGLRTTTPTRTLFDLASRQHPERTRRDLNHLWGRGLVTLDLLDEALERLATRGRGGITTMRALIADAHEKGVPVGSNLELRVEELLERAGLRAARRQLEIFDAAGLVARVDFGDPTLLLVVEVDSDRFHHGLIDRQLDASKTARLAALGWTVVRVSEHEIWHDHVALISRLRDVARELRSSRAPQ